VRILRARCIVLAGLKDHAFIFKVFSHASTSLSLIECVYSMRYSVSGITVRGKTRALSVSLVPCSLLRRGNLAY
jgi:hypothetical protein